MPVAPLNGSLKSPKSPPPKRDSSFERASAETISRLQRGILRLALAYHGRNADLDGKLKDLGGLLRAGRRDAMLQRLIDEIVNTIVSLDLDVAPPAAAVAEVAALPVQAPDEPNLLDHFLEHLETPAALVAEVERVRRRIAARNATAEVLEDVERSAALLSEKLAHATAGERYPEFARQALLDLVDRLPVSRNLAADAGQLRRTVEALARPEDMRPCAAGLSALVMRMRDELQAELNRLGEFLRSTARRLQEFEQAMMHSRENYADSAADALQLSDVVGGDLEALRESAREAQSLDDLRDLIEDRLEVIDHGLKQFVATQTRRASEAGEALERMTTRLKDLEQQAMHLREDLEVQHARVLIDPLTGILNRAGYTEMVTKHFARWKRYGGALSLAVIDLDLFKEINDRYGHAAGDKVLATVASKLKEVIRESDVLCRYGGEEFVLLLPETSVDDARTMLEKLRRHIEDCPFRHKETPVRVTMSCGVGQFRANDNIDSVFERADRAMYTAKQGGRNQVKTESDLDSSAPTELA